jgi:phenylalanyl-tRNA synthetase beta chain
MFDLGQPSHTFDAKLVGDDGFRVRQARDGEKLIGLDEVEYTFDANDTVIARGDNDEILSIAGLKGGIHSGINDATTDVIVEVANWNPITIRKSGQRLKLRTDASSRYENGIVPEMVPYGLKAVVDLIIEVAGGQLVGVDEVVKEETPTTKVSVSLSKINSVLGVELSEEDVTSILERFGWKYELNNGEFVITSPFERTDLQIAEDVIEEVGRIYGYQHVPAITPTNVPVTEINQRFYYSELVRDTLTTKGFSEVFTSSFRANDEVKLANAFASDKGYLRSTLTKNMSEALAKNGPNADLLGLRQIRLFEIGTVFNEAGESLLLTLGIQSPSGYKAKTDDPVVNEAVAALSKELGLEIKALPTNGIIEIDFGDLLNNLPKVASYKAANPYPSTNYRPFSNYPAMARDIAMWVPKETTVQDIENLLQSEAGELCVRITLFDQFEKDGRVSYAYRLAFQSMDKTLTDTEVNAIMDQVYEAARRQGFEVR